MSVIRVGFVLGQVVWLGGMNYYRNLLISLKSQPESKVRPFIFTGLKSDVSAFEGLAEIVRTPIEDRGTFQWLISRFLRQIFPKRDYLLYFLLKKHRINLMSHDDLLWRGCSIPSIAWIPDFQHIHLPQFFTKREIDSRNKDILKHINRCNAILVSSENALNDLRKFSPDSKMPTFVLRFISSVIDDSVPELSRNFIQERYGLNRPWFHVPNQFWKHKNHTIILEALHLLKQQGHSVLVVATGRTDDSRNAEYFPSLMKQVHDYGLVDDFRVLGIVPYSDVVALMRHSVAIINPSLFEGWSTSVEESKSMGKKIILSDIEVHQEQNPERAYYFGIDDYAVLAKQMTVALQEFDETCEVFHKEKAFTELASKRLNFANEFESVVLHVLGMGNNFVSSTDNND